VILPAQQNAASKWVVADYGSTWAKSSPSAGGQAVADVATVPPDELWLIDRIRVSSTSTTPTASYVCLGDTTHDVEGTASGNYDIADESSPIQAPGGVDILQLWAAGSDGSVGTVYMQWTVLRQASGV
jgi:hypothetical protein